MKEASKRLNEMNLNEKDAKDYKRYLKELRDIASEQHTKMADAQDLIRKGEEKKEIEVVLEMHKDGVPIKTIAKYLKITEEQVVQVIEKQPK